MDYLGESDCAIEHNANLFVSYSWSYCLDNGSSLPSCKLLLPKNGLWDWVLCEPGTASVRFNIDPAHPVLKHLFAFSARLCQ